MRTADEIEATKQTTVAMIGVVLSQLALLFAAGISARDEGTVIPPCVQRLQETGAVLDEEFTEIIEYLRNMDLDEAVDPEAEDSDAEEVFD